MSVDFDGSVLVAFAVFLVLFLLLKPILLDPYLKVVEARDMRTVGAKADARSMDERAGEIVKRYDCELEKVRKVAGEERERLRSEAHKLETQILGEARADAAKMAVEGKDRIREQADLVRVELQKLSDQLAQEAASKVLGRNIS